MPLSTTRHPHKLLPTTKKNRNKEPQTQNKPLQIRENTDSATGANQHQQTTIREQFITIANPTGQIGLDRAPVWCWSILTYATHTKSLTTKVPFYQAARCGNFVYVSRHGSVKPMIEQIGSGALAKSTTPSFQKIRADYDPGGAEYLQIVQTNNIFWRKCI